jgi:hypothetical protein
MITAKISKTTPTTTLTEDKLFKLLESIDWKLWEIMNMMKDNLPEKAKTVKVKAVKKGA